jgi:predicted GH43/DUF377 family glycosyl hydrolase
LFNFFKRYWSDLSICKDRILSAYSLDGTTWNHDPGIRVDVFQPPEFFEDMVYGCWVGEEALGFRMIYQGSCFKDGLWISSLNERWSKNGLDWGVARPTGVQTSSHILCWRRVQSPLFININGSNLIFFSGTDDYGVTRILVAEQASCNAWIICDDPVLTPDQYQYSVDKQITALMDPAVITTFNGGWRMYLSGCLNGSSYHHCIVSASSSDGRRWIPDPGIRIANNADGRRETANNPTVVHFGSGYRMWFRGSDMMPLNSHIYFADSIDGLEWIVKGLALRLRQWHPHERHGIGFPFVLKKNDSMFRMYYTGYWGNWRCGDTVKNYETSYLERDSKFKGDEG